MHTRIRHFLVAGTLAAVGLAALAFQPGSSAMRIASAFEEPRGAVSFLAFGPGDKVLYAGGWDGVWAWDLDSERLRRHFGNSVRRDSMLDDVAAASLASDGENIIVADNLGLLTLYSTSTGRAERLYDGSPVRTASVALSVDGKVALSGDGYPLSIVPAEQPAQFLIRLWNIETRVEARAFTGHLAAVTGVAFLSDGRSMVSASDDGTLRLWNLADGAEINRAGEAAPLPLFQINEVDYVKRPDRHNSLAVSSNGQFAIWGTTVWDIPSWRAVATLTGSTNSRMLCAAFSADSARVLTSHDNGDVCLWDTTTWSPIASAKGHTNSAPLLAVTFSRSGKLAATGGEGVIGGFEAMQIGVKPSDTVVRVWRLPESHPAGDVRP
jgi:WD40 repeat protein